jgi:thymidylate synthase (FAD)
MDINEQLFELKKPYLKTINCLDKGFVRLVDWMGSDQRIVQAARVSYGDGTKTVREDKGLIDYLMRHAHTSPFEQVQFTFHAKMPIFVARQIVRHRTAKLNEISGRYSILKDEFYEPDVSRMVKQSKDNKQGSSEELLEDAESILQSFKDEQFEMYDNYQEYIQGGMAKEMARINLPLSIYTEWYWTIDLHNLFHFLKLRMDSHAQHEVRVYADAKFNLIKDIVPFACEAFEKHVINGRKFSADEMEMIKIFLSNEEIEKLSKTKGWKDSKLKEFLDKL